MDDLQRDIADLSRAMAIHHERMESGQRQMVEKLGDVLDVMKDIAKKPSNGNGIPPLTRNGGSGIPTKFALQVIGMLLLAALAIGGGSEGAKAAMHAIENLTAHAAK